MSFTDVLSTIFEISLVLFTIWSVFHEDKFIAFEEKLFCNFKRRKFKVVKHESANNHSFNLQQL